MVYEKNFTLLAENSSQDPVKAALVFQGEAPKYDSAVEALQQQMGKAASLGLSFNNAPRTSVPFIAQLFGVKPAEAQWYVFDGVNFAQLIKQYINSIILQILKNTIVQLIQKKVLAAIQGSGAPKFVTSFASEMINSYQSAAINTINSEMSQVPLAQKGAFQMLTSISYTAPNGSTTLGTIGPNPTVNFSGNFTNMSDYLSEFNSGGNIWANAIAMRDDAMTAAANSQTAKQTQNVAQQGWQGDSTCSDGSDPQNGTHEVCEDGSVPNVRP